MSEANNSRGKGEIKMETYKGFSVEVKPAFTGFYAVVSDKDVTSFIQPANADIQLAPADAYGFLVESVAVSEARRYITNLLNKGY